MKSLVFFVAILMNFQTLAAAESIEFLPSGTAKWRESADEFLVRFPGWKRMEIVNNGVISKELFEQMDTSKWGSELPNENWYDLQVRSFDIKKTQITRDQTSAEIPFSVTTRYAKRWTESLQQGTIDSSGVIQLHIENREIVGLRITNFYYESQLEKLNFRFGYTKKYDGSFVKGVTEPLLLNFLKKDKNLATLIGLVEAYAKEKSEVELERKD